MQVSSTKYEYLLFDLRNREQGSLAIAVLQSEDALCPPHRTSTAIGAAHAAETAACPCAYPMRCTPRSSLRDALYG